MTKSLKRKFKELLAENPKMEIKDLLNKLELSDQNELENNLKKWKLDKYYEIKKKSKETIISRNKNNTPWENLKETLKKSGKWTIKSIPIAIALLSGNPILMYAINPFIDEIIKKFNMEGIEVSSKARNTMIMSIKEKSDVSLDPLVDELKETQKLVAGNHEELLNKIESCINKNLQPFITEIKEVSEQLMNQQQDLTDIFEDWIIEQITILKPHQTSINCPICGAQTKGLSDSGRYKCQYCLNLFEIAAIKEIKGDPQYFSYQKLLETYSIFDEKSVNN